MCSALLRLTAGRRKQAASRVRGLLKELGLDHVASSRIGGGSSNCGISGGERRRASIGVDLVHDPAVVLIDEPTSGLDSASALVFESSSCLIGLFCFQMGLLFITEH